MANNPQYSGSQPVRPPVTGPMDPTRTFAPQMPTQQFRPMVPPHSQQFVPLAAQHFQSLGRGVPLMNVGLPPPQPHQPQFSQSMPQLPSRLGDLGHGTLPSQVMQLAVPHTNRHSMSEMSSQPNAQPVVTSYMPGLGISGTSSSSSYNFASSYGQPQNYNTSTIHPMSQMHAPVVSYVGQPKLLSEIQNNASLTPLQHAGEQLYVTVHGGPATNDQIISAGVASTDWREHVSADGRRYYYNKKTKVSSWEKPLELMTPIERADASTNWKEFTSPEGRKYYYNKVTKESKWTIPEELKLAREQVEKASSLGTQKEAFPLEIASVSPLKVPSSADTAPSLAHEVASSPVSVAPVVASGGVQPERISPPPASPVLASGLQENLDGDQIPVDNVPLEGSVSEIAGTAAGTININTEPINSFSDPSAQGTSSSADGVPGQDVEEVKKDLMWEKVKDNASEERTIDQDVSAFADKQEAKNAFKELLESANIGSDWTWDRAMRVIINDKRYGALKTLGERKQAFNEFLGQRKKQEVEERRNKQKKAREEFKKMLEESTELSSSTRWSKVETAFETDERFRAVERDRDRRDLFDNFLEELKNKERAKAQDDRKRNIMEYRRFLESCDFIKASSQWRKVHERLEADERCSCLEKIDRLDIFQEYLRDLEKEEEEQRRIQKEELRKTERKNRDEFRKMMEEHVAEGILTPKLHWRDYCMKVKDLPAYLAVASNTSGSTPKDLFEDVAEELQKQYQEDRTRIKDAVKLGKITLSLTWTLEEFKASISKDSSSPPVSDVNLRLVFDELLERAKEKEEKEAKKRKRLADDFFHMLCSIKEISTSSSWEDCKPLFEESQEYSSIGEESLRKEIFEEYIVQLNEQAKENERKRKDEKAKKEKEREDRERRKEKRRRDKDVGREKDEHFKKDDVEGENVDVTDIHESKEYRRSEKENGKKQRKRHHGAEEHEHSSEDENGGGRSKKSHSHSDRKKSRRHGSARESDNESRRRRHRRDHRNSSHANGENEELEDGEFGEDRESR